jgi:hypothetical protein
MVAGEKPQPGRRVGRQHSDWCRGYLRVERVGSRYLQQSVQSVCASDANPALEWDHVVRRPTPNVGPDDNYLNAVAATSAANAWAVGRYYDGTEWQTLIEHWNGVTWTVQPSPDPAGPAGDNELTAVTATSPSNAWAVGYHAEGTTDVPLIEHWDGAAWTGPGELHPHEATLSGLAGNRFGSQWRDDVAHRRHRQGSRRPDQCEFGARSG